MKDTLRDYQVTQHHKDRLFRFIFKEKEALLSLYNAVNDSDYQDIQSLQIYTMEDYLYMGMKNDLSFLIDWNLNIFEHQSTYNPNMPMRGLIYMAAAYRKYVELNHLDIYASSQLTIPIPRYYVFYNGTREIEDDVLLHLTDSMKDADALNQSCAQFTAHMININAGHSPAIMERCPLLQQYATLIAEIRHQLKEGYTLKEAVNTAVNICIRNGILSDILRANKAEVTNMLLTEYDEAFHIACEKELSFKEGQESERQNTERERQNAERERQNVERERQNVERERQISQQEKMRANILACKLQGKSDEEIADLVGLSLTEVKNILQRALTLKV